MPFLAPLIPAVIGGVASTAAGAGISALAKGSQSSPQTTPIQNALQNQQVQNSIGQQNSTIDQQQQLVNALQANGGAQNQASVYNQQQGLANQLGQMAQGGGPNPALDQLNQTTGQNVAQQASLMAGQRGAGANAGLIARQAGQQGAAAQQQAAGQAATLRSQQQLGAISALQQQQSLLGNTAQNQIGNQQTGLNSLSSQNLGQQSNLINAVQGNNAQNLQQQQGINNIQASQGAQQAGLMGQIGGGVASGLGSSITSALAPTTGGMPAPAGQASTPPPTMLANGGNVQQGGPEVALKENYKGKSKLGSMLYANGGKVHKKVPALVSPGEIYLPPKKAQAVKAGKASPLSGEKIKGEAVVKGDRNSYANDTVPKKLEAGGIVLPRSVTQSAKPKESAIKFIDALKKKHGVK